MFILSKRNIVIPAPDGMSSIKLTRDDLTTVPDWAAETDYFKELVADGKIVPTTSKDKNIQDAAEKKVKIRRGKEITEE